MGNPITIRKSNTHKHLQHSKPNAVKNSVTPAVPDSLLLNNLIVGINPGHGEREITEYVDANGTKHTIEHVATGAVRPAPHAPTNTTYKIAGYDREFSNDSIYEMNLNDSVAIRVSKNMKKYGAHVIYMDNLPKAEIRKMQKDSCINSLVAIHHNTNANPKEKGNYVLGFGKSLNLATAMTDNLKSDSTAKNLGIKADPAKTMYILKKAKNAVLIECGFMSSTDELKRITTTEYYDQMADNLSNGLLDFYLGKDKAAPKKIHPKKVVKKPETFDLKPWIEPKKKQPLCIYPPYSLYQQ